MYLAIPKGIKCFFWITKYNDQDASFLLFLNEQKQIIHHKYHFFKRNNFSSSVNIKNVLLYGTYFEQDKIQGRLQSI